MNDQETASETLAMDLNNNCCSSRPGSNRRSPDVYIPLDSESDLELFSQYRSNQVSFTDHSDSGRKVKRVHIPKDQHYGMAMQYHFSGADEVTLRWEQYLPDEWMPARGTHIKFPGIGNRDEHGWGGRRTDGTSGWTVRTGLRNQPDQNNAVTVEFYVYHMEMGRWGSIYSWDRDENGAGVYRGEWTEMEIYVRVNTPGEDDGIICGWINGEQRFEKTDLKFRAEGYDQYDIREIIWDIYHGGAESSPIDQDIYFRNLKIWYGSLNSETDY
ncbi:MAG: hypothetical protein JJU13_13140 [Balneolaceae bacterium]|nr:hypothetical protein [Balneolaceae bacterium]